MACTACFVCLISTVSCHSKKKTKNALENVALAAGTYQNLSNLHSLDIYANTTDNITLFINVLETCGTSVYLWFEVE